MAACAIADHAGFTLTPVGSLSFDPSA